MDRGHFVRSESLSCRIDSIIITILVVLAIFVNHTFIMTGFCWFLLIMSSASDNHHQWNICECWDQILIEVWSKSDSTPNEQLQIYFSPLHKILNNWRDQNSKLTNGFPEYLLSFCKIHIRGFGIGIVCACKKLFFLFGYTFHFGGGYLFFTGFQYLFARPTMNNLANLVQFKLWKAISV